MVVVKCAFRPGTSQYFVQASHGASNPIMCLTVFLATFYQLRERGVCENKLFLVFLWRALQLSIRLENDCFISRTKLLTCCKVAFLNVNQISCSVCTWTFVSGLLDATKTSGGNHRKQLCQAHCRCGRHSGAHARTRPHENGGSFEDLQARRCLDALVTPCKLLHVFTRSPT